MRSSSIAAGRRTSAAKRCISVLIASSCSVRFLFSSRYIAVPPGSVVRLLTGRRPEGRPYVGIRVLARVSYIMRLIAILREYLMRENRLKGLWADDHAALGGWLTIPSSLSAEYLAHAGLDWLCIDMQHGSIDYQVAVTMLQAISTTETVPIVRVPWNEPGIIMKSLDAGAYGVIVPMVNSRREADAAV